MYFSNKKGHKCFNPTTRKIHVSIDGSIERYKARLIAKGFTQTYGINYQETFASVAKINSIYILLSLVVHFNWPLHQLDVKTLS